MKKALLLSFFIFSFSISKAQWVTIPDANFVAWLQTIYPTCMNGMLMDTTCSGIVNDINIYCQNQNFSDLTGIQYFDNLLVLDCSNNQITNLPALPNSLMNLYCNNNSLTSLPSLPNSLTSVHCWYNSLTSLPSLPNSLYEFMCSYNSLTSLPALPNSLATLDCRNNSLTILPSLPDSLNQLSCSNNSISSLPSLPNSLTSLDCSNNPLGSLPSLPDSLTVLNCFYNSLTSLPPMPNTLIFLWCYNNSLTSLPLLSDSLFSLLCNNNSLTSLPSLPSSLTNLRCYNNSLTSLPSLPNSLTYLDCYNNSLTSLPSLPNSMYRLYCNNNSLTSLPALPNSLTQFNCSNNTLTSLPLLPNSLPYLVCNNNSLTSLPSLPNSLTDLICYNNSLTNLPVLPPLLHYFQIQNNPDILCMPPLLSFYGGAVNFDISNTGITCLPNYIQHGGYIAAIDTMPVCDVFNTNGCNGAWSIKGTIVIDSDNSCATTNDGTGVSMIKLNLFDSGSNLIQQVIANWGGDFSFNTQLGNYSTSVDTLYLPFNVLCPTNNSIASNLTATDSIDYNVDFRLICKPGFDIGVWSTIANNIFFPGNSTSVFINAGDFSQSLYNVSCNSGISGEVKVVINGPANYLSPIAGALTPTVNGDTLIYTISDFSLVNAATDFAFNVITHSNAQSGNQICFSVTVTPTSGDNNISNNILTHCFTVSNSFDPNEKEVSPVGSLAYPYNDWLTYTIHFQNTGTAAAQHIQVLDTLDADLDASTFQLLSYSHTPMVQITGSNVAFNFVNINLPDSTTNLAGSMGYVIYRVMPMANLLVGTAIENTASIYFDFNTPVVTNTVSNIICNPTTSTTTSTICEGDIYFFEGSNLTIAGNYSVTLQAVDGCDSILNLNLLVDPTIINSISQSICSGITFDFNGQQLSSSGIYHDTLIAITGCDSIVNLTLTIIPPAISINETICFGDSIIFNGNYYSTNSVHIDTLLNSLGCDSIVTLTLSVLPLVASSVNQTICFGDSVNFNGTYYDSTAIYADTLSTAGGCDSIAYLNLTVLNAATSSFNQTICIGESFLFNGINETATGIYYDTLNAANNCDSVIALHLTVNNPNATIQLNGNTLTATGNGIIQWINCDSGTFVIGAVGETFTPTVIGHYAAWVWDGLCNDTTNCIEVLLDGINEQFPLNNNQFSFYPNPVDENIIVQLSQPCENCRMEITNTLGGLVQSAEFKVQSMQLDIHLLPAGVYFISVHSDKMSAVKKFVKQ